ncbi:MAG: hypothetical protein MHMPM18_001269, partial [Marteilia pararefringens]
NPEISTETLIADLFSPDNLIRVNTIKAHVPERSHRVKNSGVENTGHLGRNYNFISKSLQLNTLPNFYTIVQIQTVVHLHTMKNLSSSNIGYFYLIIEDTPSISRNCVSFFSPKETDFEDKSYLYCEKSAQMSSYTSKTYRFKNPKTELKMDEKFIINTVMALNCDQAIGLYENDLHYFLRFKFYYSASLVDSESFSNLEDVIVQLSLNKTYFTSYTTYIPLINNSAYILTLSSHSFANRICVRNRRDVEQLFPENPFTVLQSNGVDKCNAMFYLNAANNYLKFFYTLVVSFGILELIYSMETLDTLDKETDLTNHNCNEKKDALLSNQLNSADFKHLYNSKIQELVEFLRSRKSLEYYDRSAEEFLDYLPSIIVPYWYSYLKKLFQLQEHALLPIAKLSEIIEEKFHENFILTLLSSSVDHNFEERQLKISALGKFLNKAKYRHKINYPPLHLVQSIDIYEETKNLNQSIENKLEELGNKISPCTLFEFMDSKCLSRLSNSIHNPTPSHYSTFLREANDLMCDKESFAHDKTFEAYRNKWSRSNMASKSNVRRDFRKFYRQNLSTSNICTNVSNSDSLNSELDNPDEYLVPNQGITDDHPSLFAKSLIQKLRNSKKALPLPKALYNGIISIIQSHYYLQKYLENIKSTPTQISKLSLANFKFGSLASDYQKNFQTLPIVYQKKQLASKHIVFFIHGLEGSAEDMLYLLRYLQIFCPSLMCMTLEIAAPPEESIENQADSVAPQIFKALKKYTDNIVLSISFVAFSLGTIIVREIIGRAEFAPYLVNLQNFVSLCGPHLSLMFTSKYHSMAMWVANRIHKCICLSQLEFKDQANSPRNKYLYRLSLSAGLGRFRNLILCSALNDQVVPHSSALLQVPSVTSFKIPAAVTQPNNLNSNNPSNWYIEMHSNVTKQLEEGQVNVVRYLSQFSPCELIMRRRLLVPGMDVHTCFLSESFAKHFVTCVLRYYFE